MTKYELSLTRDYVPDWTLVDAVRELFQNALDQETVAADNKMFWEYSEGIFKVGNKLSVLEPKSLLLGATTKAGDDKTIGKFGEGYKIATLVLTRLGKVVTFYNYGAREVWRARFSKSRKYGAEILVFEVDKKYPWTSVPDNNLTISIEGITEQEFSEIRSSNLHISKKNSDFIQTPKGRILLDPDSKAMMYVNGLLIRKSEGFTYGYDFNPDQIALDRDRKLIQDFDLKWTTSQMWLSGGDQVATMAAELVKDNSPDTAYLTEVSYGYEKIKPISEKATESFTATYGKNAVPVSSQEQAELIPNSHKAIIVTENLAKVIKSNPSFTVPPKVTTPSLADKVESWLDKYGANIKRAARRELQGILNEDRQTTGESPKSDLPF